MSSTDLTVRVAGFDDIDALSAIGHDSFRAAYQGSGPDDELEKHLNEVFGRASIQAEIALPKVSYLLAIAAQEPAGLVKIQTGEVPDAVPGKEAIEIPQLYVATNKQRLGVGAALMDAAVAFGRDRAVSGIWLTVWEKADWAINFYLANGFTQVGVMDYPMGSIVFHDFLMWRPITNP